MDKISGSTDQKQSKSLLFRLFSGDRGALAHTDVYAEAIEEENTAAPAADIPTETAEAETQPIPEVTDNSSAAAEAPQQEHQTEEHTETQADAEHADAAHTDAEHADAAHTDAAPDVDDNPPPVDAGIKVRISADGLEAYVTLAPPQNGGAEIGAKAIRTALKAEGIINGILDRAMFEISMSKPYNSGEILVAQGTHKEDGKDGVVTELFPREIDVSPYQNPDGTVDFKRLNIVRELKAGTPIATLELPTEGSDGMNVKGEIIKAKPGATKPLLRGANTVISEDGLQLLTEKAGHLAYKEGKFLVETTFVVGESVDNNTGNITFSGDILIKGDVREGYTVRAGGAVKVKGVVEGGSIYAGGDINIDGGFNGMKRGELETNKNLTSKFLQNCTVRAKEDITSEAVINSIVFCDGLLTVTKNKGVIVGGRCTVLRSVEAKVLGTDVNTPTQITVGLSPTILAEKQELEKAIEETENSKDMLAKNLVYLERCAKMGKLSDRNVALQENCNKQKVLIMVREATYHKRLEAINVVIEEAAAGSLVKAQTVYPSTKITIKSQSIITRVLQHRCIFRMENGELVTATF